MLTTLAVLLPIALALLAAPIAAGVGAFRPAYAAPVGAAFATLAALSVLWGWSAGGSVDLAWAPSWDLRISLSLDGLAALYALLATGIGFLVLVYSSRYLPLHLEHEGRPESAAVRFYFFVLLFMGSMVGLAMAQDLILLFLFWDLTAIASYYLIGYDAHKEESRASALMALLVTGVTAVLLLIGALLLYAAHDTFSIPELARRVAPGPLLTGSGLLIVVAGLAKSAQVPLHFWLPRAMAAPTPVSAYLHSAAMVAAGVLLIGRVYPLLQNSDFILDTLLVVGIASMAVGGVLALTRDVLKQLLAYSTIAQYGFVVTMYGLGGEYGAGGAAYYVIAHAIAKSALFLTAGAVTEATGQDHLSKLGGLLRPMPLLAVSSGLAAATLTSLPLTLGFFADEFFFAAALERGLLFATIAVVSAAATLAYTWRFWGGIFLGESHASSVASRPVPRLLVAPVVALGAIGLLGGLFAGPFERLAEAAGEVSFAAPTPLDATYHAEVLPEYVNGPGGLRSGRGGNSFALCMVEGSARVQRPREAGGARKVVPSERSRAQPALGPRPPAGDPQPERPGRFRAVADGHARGRGRAGNAHSRRVPGRRVPGRGDAANAGDVGGGGGLPDDDLHAAARYPGSRALQRGLRAGGRLCILRSAERGARRGPCRDHGHATRRRHPQADPYRILHRQAELPLPRRGRNVFVSVVAGVFAFVVVWGSLAAAGRHDRRRRTRAARPAGARQERGHGHAG